MSCERHEAKKIKARELRVMGFSTPQIARMLAVKSHRTIAEWVKGIPNPEWTKRPRAKDDLREVARAMRLEGRSYREIRTEVPVSKSTLSEWLKDVPISEEQAALLLKRQFDSRERRATALRARRIATQERIWQESAAEIGAMSERELLIAGAVAYWAEGAKAKPWRTNERVQFINSDATMIRLFLRWLDSIQVSRDDLVLRVSIHETADVVKAVRYWADVCEVDPSVFRRTTLKRHNPRTVRKNSGDSYVGCLTINVRRSTELYRRITGWWQGIVAALPSEGVQMAGSVTGSTGPFEGSSLGSNPNRPATLFERPIHYIAARAS
jgi:transposase